MFAFVFASCLLLSSNQVVVDHCVFDPNCKVEKAPNTGVILMLSGLTTTAIGVGIITASSVGYRPPLGQWNDKQIAGGACMIGGLIIEGIGVYIYEHRIKDEE